MVAGSNVSVSMSNKSKYGSMSGPTVITASQNSVTEYKNTTNYEEIDYNQIPEEEKAKTEDEATASPETTNEEDFWTKENMVDIAVNKAFWAASKPLIKDGLNAVISSLYSTTVKDVVFTDNIIGILFLSGFEGGYKALLQETSTGATKWSTFVSGSSKCLSSNLLKKGTQAYFKNIGKFADSKALKGSIGKISSVLGDKSYGELIKSYGGYDKLPDSTKILMEAVKKENFANSMGTMAIGTAIDFGASLFANYMACKVEGKEVNFENLKVGSSLLKSSTKIICAVAGRLIGSTFGAGDAGEKIGTVVGTVIGEFQVEAFDGDETWCFVAGGAQLAGAVAGAAIVTFCVSNPAGWVLGVGILVGAAVGFTVTFLAYHFKDEIVALASSVVAGAKEFAADVCAFANKLKETAGELIVKAGEELKAAAEFVEGKIESAVETLVEMKDVAIKNAIEFKDNFVEGVVELKDNFVEGAVELKDNFVEGAVEFKDNLVEGAVEFKDTVEDAVKANPVTDFLIGWAF